MDMPTSTRVMNQKALDRAIKSLAINDIYLCENNATLARNSNAKYNLEPLSVQFRYSPDGMFKGDGKELDAMAEDPEQKLVFFRLNTGIRFVVAETSDSPEQPEKGESRVRAEVCATFIVEYRVTTDTFPDDEALEEFAHSNAMYHAWPYWREYVHSTCARMRLPTVVMPMYKAAARPSKSQKPRRVRSHRPQ